MSVSILHLLHRAGQIADEAFSAHGAYTGAPLTARQAVVLAAILAHDAPSQTDLVAATGIDRSTMANIVCRLTHRGLVARRRTRDDARRYAVRLTEKGKVAALLAEEAQRRAERDLLKRLPAGLRGPFRDALRALALDSQPERAPALVAAE